MRQLEGMFDVPRAEESVIAWKGELPIEDFDWNVGLIVGPSGSGKSTILTSLFGAPVEFAWSGDSLLDDFDAGLSMSQIADVCRAVGFNTIPAWMRPFGVLSNGERFRVDMARRLLEAPDPITVDEFTSVVDRQVAQIGSHAVQKYVRRHGKRFIAATCHYDVTEWLQPDWVFEPGTMTFQRRRLQQRPRLDCEIQRVDYPAWNVFAPYHYLTTSLHRSAACYVLFVKGRPAAFAGILFRPHAKVQNIMGVSRLVTLPDWQGMGLAMVLAETLGAAYRSVGKYLHTYPAHPSLIHSFAKSRNWSMRKKPGYSAVNRETSTLGKIGGRPCAVFRYEGMAMGQKEGKRLIDGL